MKKILIIHPALVIGGAETVLINYLKILSELDNKYDVELLLLENRVNFNIGSIPKNIKVEFILSDIESEFFIYTFLNLNRENNHYYYSWQQGIKEKINHRISEKINSDKFDILIDFHRNISNFEHFMNHFDVSKILKYYTGFIVNGFWIHGRKISSIILLYLINMMDLFL